jgi:hypothetical protein
MTEAQWLSCSELEPMLDFLLDSAGVSDRTLRLFMAACCRRVWHLLLDPVCREAVEVAEQFAEGSADPLRLDEAQSRAHECAADLSVGPYKEAAEAADWAAWPDAGEAAALVSEATSRALGWESAGSNGEFLWREGRVRAEQRSHCALLRELVGPLPFRALTINSAWLRWNHGTVPAIARRIYEERVFHDMPILADALEDAGCTDAALLDHCRAGVEHVRGCWAVDVLLGKGSGGMCLGARAFA